MYKGGVKVGWGLLKQSSPSQISRIHRSETHPVRDRYPGLLRALFPVYVLCFISINDTINRMSSDLQKVGSERWGHSIVNLKIFNYCTFCINIRIIRLRSKIWVPV